MLCKNCSSNINGSFIADYIEHLKSMHPTLVNFFCPHCDGIFKKRYELKRHLNKIFKNGQISFVVEFNPLSNTTDSDEIDKENVNTTNINHANSDCNNELNNWDELIRLNIENDTIEKKKKARYVIETDENLTAEQFIANSMEDLLKLLANPKLNRDACFKIHKNVIKRQIELLDLIKKDINDQDNRKLIENISSLIKDNLYTEHLLQKYLKNNNLWIESKKVLIGQDHDLPLDAKDDTTVQTIAIQYSSFITILDMLLRQPHILDHIVSFVESCGKSSEVTYIYECELFQEILEKEKATNKDFDETIYIPFSIYIDDFDPKNTLGSHGGSYKIGHAYVLFHCFSIEIKSKLDFVFLAMSYFSGDLKSENGINDIFSRLVNEINSTFYTKIKINHPKYKFVQLRFTFFMGDNLEIHELFGLIAYFRANILCKFCYAPAELRFKLTKELDYYLRNEYRHERDLAELNTAKSGVTHNTVFNKINNFCPIKNQFVDLMHDVLLGSFKYDVSYALFEMIKSDKLDLNRLNTTIKKFNPGPSYKNKIDTITKERLKSGKLKASSSEMLNFILHLPFLLHLCDVNFESKYFKIILSCKNLLVMLLRQTIQTSYHVQLEHKISNHLHLVLEVLGPLDYTLKYKHHIQIHYPNIIKKVGALVNYWCMRPESKHSLFKTCAQNSNSCRNLLVTFITRNQYQFAYFLLTSKTILNNAYSYPNPVPIEKSKIENKFSLTIPWHQTIIQTTEQFSYISNTFCINSILPTNISDDEETFGQIKKIILYEEKIYLIAKEVFVIFEEYLEAYEVLGFSSSSYLISFEDIACYTRPLKLFSIKDKSYVNSLY